MLEPVRDFKARHASTLLTFDAVVDALEQIEARQAAAGGGMSRPRSAGGAHLAIRGYQLTLSGLVGRQCRHLPSCSDYTDEAIQRHGLWAGGWMGVGADLPLRPFGTSGLDLVPEALPASARWYKPWAYGRWRGVLAPPAIRCEAAEPDGGRPAR